MKMFHILFGIDGAVADDFLAAFSDAVVASSFMCSLMYHRAIRTGNDRLARTPGPVNHRAAMMRARDDFRLHVAERSRLV